MVIISDPHACYFTFKKLVETILAKYPNEKFCVAGDLIDRGPRSKEIVQYVIDNKIDCVKGNHEEMLVDETRIKEGKLYVDYASGIWLMNGGKECYDSYFMESEDLFTSEWDGTSTPKIFDIKTFEAHREWMSKLPYFLEYKDIKDKKGKYLLVTHAAATEIILDGVIATREIIWNRKLPKKLKDRYNIYGHTPQPKPLITNYYANLDTGCYIYPIGEKILGQPVKYGKMTALCFPSMEVFQQDNIDGYYNPPRNEMY